MVDDNLKTFVDHLIADDKEQAQAAFHDYLRDQIQSSIAPTTDSSVQQTDNEE